MTAAGEMVVLAINNLTSFPTGEIEELVAFIIGERATAMAGRFTLEIVDDPETSYGGVWKGLPDDPFQGGRLIVSVAGPEEMMKVRGWAVGRQVPLRDWRERLVHNLASALGLGPVMALNPRFEWEIAESFEQHQEGVLRALERYWSAVTEKRFSWQHD